MHRFPKSWYKRTNRRNFPKQLAKIERRRARLRQLRASIKLDPQQEAELKEQEAAARRVDIGYYIGTSENTPYRLSDFARNGKWGRDRTCKVCFRCLLLRRDFNIFIFAGVHPKAQETPAQSLR